MKIDALRPFIQKTLCEITGLKVVEPDEHGDYVLRFGSAQIVVSIVDADPAVIRFWSALLRQVRVTTKTLKTLNGINRDPNFAFGRLFATEDCVMLVMDVPSVGVDRRVLQFACERFSELADTLDTVLLDDIGGKTAHPDDETDDESPMEVE